MRCHPNYFGRVSKNVVIGGGSIIFFVTRGNLLFFKLLVKFQFLSSFFIHMQGKFNCDSSLVFDPLIYLR